MQIPERFAFLFNIAAMIWYKNNLTYAFVAVVLLLSLIQLQASQIALSIWVNGINLLWLDKLCLYGTFLGDGAFVIGFCVILFFFKPRMSVVILLSYLMSSAITQGLKHLLFSDLHRPLWHLEKLDASLYHVIAGADVVYNNSFPSGHTTSAFAFFISLALFLKRQSVQILLLMLALFIGFTRIYLFQHFLIDTFAGAIIGFSTAYFVYFTLYQKGNLDGLFLKIKR
ncbi:MAG: phosphatase PAP2 family protein [bacterium]|nr:phosphatase PAP2 family protein [bacterium]